MKKIIFFALILVCQSCIETEVRKEFFENGNLKMTSTYKNGILDGEQVTFYVNGRIKEQKYWKQGKMVDSVFIFDKDGLLLNNGIVEGNLLKLFRSSDSLLLLESCYDGEWLEGKTKTYATDGSLRSLNWYVDGLKDGVQFLFYSDSTISTCAFYSKGVLEGKTTKYYENGNVKQIINFSAGKISGMLEEYYENGILRSKGEYILSEPIGKHYYYNNKGKIINVKNYSHDGKK